MTERFARLHLVAALVGLITVGAVGFAQEMPDAGPELVQVDSGAADLAPPAPTEAPVDPEQNLGAYLGRLFEAVKSGEWLLAAALAVIGLTWALRRWGAKLIPWLGTDRGGVVVAGVSAFALGLANAGIAGKPVDVTLVVTALEVALLAMGGWAGIRKLLGISNASST